MEDRIKISCPLCDHKLKAPAKALGRQVTCPSCDKKFTVKKNGDEPDSLASKKVSSSTSKRLSKTKKRKKSNSLVWALGLVLCGGAVAATMLYKPSEKNEKSLSLTETTPAPETVHKGLLAEVKETCFRCHGAIKNGNPRIKGDFDLRPLMAKSEIDLADSAKWRLVLEQVENGNMPPEDTKEELSEEEREEWADKLYEKLNHKDMKGRMLTAAEIDSDHSIMYQYDKDHYDPFETLKLLKISESRYPTINSAKLMSRTFLESMQYGLEELVRDYTQNKYRASHGHTAKVGESYDCSIRTGVTSSAEKLDEDDKSSKYFDFRTWGRQRLYTKGHPSHGIVPGKYRLTFTANSMNRYLVAKVTNQYQEPKQQRFLGGHLDVWGDLQYSKARISLINSGNPNKQTRKDGVFHTFEIEDGVEKEYSCEFTMTTASLLDLSWDNGPYNGRKHWVKLGREKRLDGEDYNFPCVRIKNVKLTKLDEVSSKSEYDISYLADKPDKKNTVTVLTEEIAKEKLTAFTKKLGLTNAESRILKIFSDLPEDMPLREKYATAMRLVSMSADYLYIEFNRPEKGGAVRYVAYSLLKQKTSEQFKKDYSEFASGSMSSNQFAERVINNPEFKNYLKHFVVNWFKFQVMLDTKKFNQKLQNFEYYDETIEYLSYLFTNNRPLKELYHSDYRILNAKMASFYHLESKVNKGFVKYAAPQGGVLQQVAFFATQSDGIDGLPFRRAEWISENVFDKHLGSPPVNIDTDEFTEARELKSFKERTEFHSKHGACAACHEVIDPIAFAVNHRGTLGKDLSKLPKNAIGIEHASVDAFYKKVSETDRKIASAFTKNLVSYTVGRDLTVFDNIKVEEILNKTSSNGFKAREVLAEIIEIYFK